MRVVAVNPPYHPNERKRLVGDPVSDDGAVAKIGYQDFVDGRNRQIAEGAGTLAVPDLLRGG